jgi:hypothetical protein
MKLTVIQKLLERLLLINRSTREGIPGTVHHGKDKLMRRGF